MRKSVGLVMLAAILVLATATTVFAGLTWCMTDPNIQLPGNGGVVHLQVGVPDEYRDAGFTLDVWAPAGSQVVGQSGKVELTVVLHEGPDNQLTASVDAGFPVLLAAKYRDQQMDSYVFEDGSGTATWSW